MGNINVAKEILLGDEYTRVWAKVCAGENFALIRNGDGERGLMTAQPFSAQEGWKSGSKMTELGRALKESISVDDDRYIIGISCPCCDPAAYKWYLKNIPGKNITFANLWVNSNYKRFFEDFSGLQRDAVVIANYRARGKQIGNLNILDYFCVSDDCVEFWNNEADRLINRILEKYGQTENLLYVVSAGPMSGPIIMRLFQNNPKNCYVDFGSSIDSFYWEKITRPYMRENTVYAQQKCRMPHPDQDRKESLRIAERQVRKHQRRAKRKSFRKTVKLLPKRCVRKLFGDHLVDRIKAKLQK